MTSHTRHVFLQTVPGADKSHFRVVTSTTCDWQQASAIPSPPLISKGTRAVANIKKQGWDGRRADFIPSPLCLLGLNIASSSKPVVQNHCWVWDRLYCSAILNLSSSSPLSYLDFVHCIFLPCCSWDCCWQELSVSSGSFLSSLTSFPKTSFFYHIYKLCLISDNFVIHYCSRQGFLLSIKLNLFQPYFSLIKLPRVYLDV